MSIKKLEIKMKKSLDEMSADELMVLANKKREEEVKSKMSVLEKEFREAVNLAKDQIDKKLATATALINDAVALSEAYGIPFVKYDLPRGYKYIPRAFHEKFDDLNRGVVEQLLEDYIPLDAIGWVGSSYSC